MPGPLSGDIGVGNLQSKSENTTERSHDLFELLDVALNLSESFEVSLAEVDLLPLRSARTRDGNP